MTPRGISRFDGKIARSPALRRDQNELGKISKTPFTFGPTLASLLRNSVFAPGNIGLRSAIPACRIRSGCSRGRNWRLCGGRCERPRYCFVALSDWRPAGGVPRTQSVFLSEGTDALLECYGALVLALTIALLFVDTVAAQDPARSGCDRAGDGR